MSHEPIATRHMRSPPPHNNNHRNDGDQHFHSTVSLHKLRRFNLLILLLRFAAFCFSFTSAVFMLTNARSSASPRWSDYDAFRFVMAATLIVAVYSLFEMGASVWEISRATTLLPEGLQVWFDFGHDQFKMDGQVFTYLVLSSTSAGTELARRLRDAGTCAAATAFCVQSDIAIALGFVAFSSGHGPPGLPQNFEPNISLGLTTVTILGIGVMCAFE
ncbi:hypothetical protein QQ045_029668 [Rhodiola kirilowii]